MSDVLLADVSEKLDKLAEQTLTLQKTVDKHHEYIMDFLEENNDKTIQTRDRVTKLESVFREIVETFKDVSGVIHRQTKKIESAVKESVSEEIKPIQEEVERITVDKKVVRVEPKEETFGQKFWAFVRR